MSIPPRGTPELLKGQLETLQKMKKNTINKLADYKSYFQTHLPHIEQEQREEKIKEYNTHIEQLTSMIESIKKEIKEKECKIKEYKQ